MEDTTKDGNEKECKKAVLVSFLEKFGYQVNDFSGKTNYYLNLFEIVLQLIYFSLSLYNALRLFNSSNSISIFNLLINILVLAKIWTKHMKKAHEFAESNQSIKSLEPFCGVIRVSAIVYRRKMIFTNAMTLIAATLIIYSKIFGYNTSYDPIAFVGIIVTVTTFADGMLSTLESMYQARTKNYNILTMTVER